MRGKTQWSGKKIRLISIIPFHFLPIYPCALPFYPFFVPVASLPILLPIFPVPAIGSSIRPNKLSKSLFFIIAVFAFVSAAIRPEEDSFAVHFVVPPRALILSSVNPKIMAESFNVVVFKLSFILAAIAPVEGAMSFLESLMEEPLILSVVHPLLYPESMLLVIHPLPRVGSPVFMQVYTFPLGFIICPLSLIHISTGVDQPSFPVGHVISPHALIYRTVSPYLLSIPFSLIASPLPLIHHPSFQLFPGGELLFREGEVLEWAQPCIGILNSLWTIVRQVVKIRIVSYVRTLIPQGQVDITLPINMCTCLTVTHFAQIQTIYNIFRQSFLYSKYLS